MRPSLGWFGQVLAWLTILAVVLVLAVAVLVPRLAGATPYTVLTGSMQPNHPPGSLVVVKPVSIDEIRTGDVITYQLESGKAAVVTHRVVATSVNLKGETLLTTQGDANGVADAEPVRAVQIKGRLWYSVPYLGHVNNALTGHQRQIAVYGVGSALVLYAAYMFTSAARDRVRSSRAAQVSTTPREEASRT